jgi:hypothetical protein
MKILKTFVTLLFVGAPLFFSACNKHYTTPQDADQVPGAKIIKIGDDLNNNQFEYDAGLRVSSLTVVTDSVPTTYNITYQNGVPTQLQSLYFLNKLTYADNRLTRLETYYTNAPEVQSLIVYNYSGSTLTEQLFYEKPISSTVLRPQLKYKFETLPNGDISMAEIFIWDANTGQYKFLGINRYDYDGHPNPVYPLKYLRLFYSFPATPHNIRAITNYDPSGTLVNTFTYDYTYNNDGYPAQAKETQTPTGGFSSFSTVTYTYQ